MSTQSEAILEENLIKQLESLKYQRVSIRDELLQNYKKAMMQKIFSQKLRLKEVLDYEQPTKYIVKSTEYYVDFDFKIKSSAMKLLKERNKNSKLFILS